MSCIYNFPHCSAHLLALTSALAVLVPLTGLAQEAKPEDKAAIRAAWSKSAILLFGEAYEDFKAMPATDETILGKAVNLMNVQPKTSTNLRRAEEILLKLEASTQSDAIKAATIYFRARILDVHEYNPKYAEAIKLYQKAAADYPETFYGQLSGTKLIVHYLAPLNEKDAFLKAYNEKCLPLMETMTEPTVLRNAHYALGELFQLQRYDDELAFNHYKAAEEIGLDMLKLRTDILLRLGHLANELGREEEARSYWLRFIKTYPLDSRSYMIRKDFLKLGDDEPLPEEQTAEEPKAGAEEAAAETESQTQSTEPEASTAAASEESEVAGTTATEAKTEATGGEQ